jgi:hypothetical protein
MDDVDKLLQVLIHDFMAPRVDTGMRVYVATDLSFHAQEFTKAKYRLLYSSNKSGGDWRKNSLIGVNSAIHNCMLTGRPQPSDKHQRSAQVEDEKDVNCRRVNVGGFGVCVVAVSSHVQARKRISDLCEDFRYILQSFFGIVALHIRLGDLRPYPGNMSEFDHEQVTKDNTALTMRRMLAYLNEWESFNGKKPKDGLEISDSLGS